MVRRRITRTFLTALALMVSSVLSVGSAAEATSPPPYYLALGDSVAFGYTPPQVTPAAWYFQPWRFRGYPEDLAVQLGLRDFNASCPGETTASFIDATAPSNGCENSATSDIGYRDLFPLHVSYPRSQLAYARHFLVNKSASTQLVSIDIGANDIFLCQVTTADQCTGSDFAATLHEIAANLSTILATLRGTGYAGTLVVLGYYAISYTDPIQVAGTQLLDQTLSSVAQGFGAVVADGFTAFQNASAPTGGDPCAAGLLIRMPDGSCNIHPSAYGHSVLAHTIANAIS